MTRRNSSFMRSMRDAGWQLVRQSNHQVWRCPCGQHQAVVPSTYGEGRSYANTVALIRRLGCPFTPQF